MKVNMTKEEFEDKVDEWHLDPTIHERMSFHEYLGLDEETYKEWIMNPDHLQFDDEG